MSSSIMRRSAALMVLVVGIAVVGCWPRTQASLITGLTPMQMDSALASVAWTGCATVKRAAVGGDSTDVEICAAPDARAYGPGNPPGGKGTLVARLRNLGQRVEKRWGLQPNATYPIWLYTGVGGTLYTITGNGVNVTGTYHGCGYHAANSSRANFGSCAENPRMVSSDLGHGTVSRGPSGGGGDKDEHILHDRASGPAWISCTEGCCTTDPL